MGLFFPVCLFTIILLLLLDTVDIGYTYDGKQRLLIGFSVFELTLWGFDNSFSKFGPKIKKSLRALPYIKSTLDYTLSHSDVVVNSNYGKESPDKAITARGVYSALSAIALSYLGAKAKSLTVHSGAEIDAHERNEAKELYPREDTKELFIFVFLKLRLIHLLIGLLIGFFGYFKKLIKVEKKIGR